MKYLMVILLAIVAASCKPSYMYERQQRAGDLYGVEWITVKDKVATCFIVDGSAGSITTSAQNGLETSMNRFIPDGGTLNIYNAKGILIESVPIRDHIYYCSSIGYSKISRTKVISDLISTDYRDMDGKLIDHLQATKTIP